MFAPGTGNQADKKIARRTILAAGPLALLAAAGRNAPAENPLHVLRGDDLQRLRFDFNASRSKVRLVLLLSPT